MSRPNRKNQQIIVSMLINLNELKKNSLNDSHYDIVPKLDYFIKNKYLTDGKYKFKTKEKYNRVVLKAKDFVTKVIEKNQEDYWNRAIFYCPNHTEYSEIGIIDFFELLFEKL